MIDRVQRTSSPSLRPRMVEVPSASAANSSTRWEMDLSPGTRSRPRSGPPDRTSKVSTAQPGTSGLVDGR
jgi:hypothetical protein